MPVHVRTDEGPGFLKARGGSVTADLLAREWIGTALAKSIGLTTFEIGQIQVPDLFVKHLDGRYAQPGLGLITKQMRGGHWSGFRRDLEPLENLPDLAKLVLIDTWLLNFDRCPPPELRYDNNISNVFMGWRESEPTGPWLVAMDFSHCLSVHTDFDLTPNLGRADIISDPKTYGLFPAFLSLITEEHVNVAVESIRSPSDTEVTEIVNATPNEWGLNGATKEAISRMLVQRRQFLLMRSNEYLRKMVPQVGMFEGEGGE